MSRTYIQFNVQDTQQAYGKMCYILSQNGFKNVVEKNENLWKWGMGLLTAPKYIRIDIPRDHVIMVSAWIKPFMMGEMEIDNSFVELIPKEEMKSVIRVLQQNIF